MKGKFSPFYIKVVNISYKKSKKNQYSNRIHIAIRKMNYLLSSYRADRSGCAGSKASFAALFDRLDLLNCGVSCRGFYGLLRLRMASYSLLNSIFQAFSYFVAFLVFSSL